MEPGQFRRDVGEMNYCAPMADHAKHMAVGISAGTPPKAAAHPSAKTLSIAEGDR
jgi:hypothetical protein